MKYKATIELKPWWIYMVLHYSDLWWALCGDDTQPGNPNKTPKNALFGIAQVRGKVQDVLNFHWSLGMIKGMMQSCFEVSEVTSGGHDVFWGYENGVWWYWRVIKGSIYDGRCDQWQIQEDDNNTKEWNMNEEVCNYSQNFRLKLCNSNDEKRVSNSQWLIL